MFMFIILLSYWVRQVEGSRGGLDRLMRPQMDGREIDSGELQLHVLLWR
jgi:hypothetical protein